MKRRATVLLVDDDPGIRSTLSDFLAAEGFDTVVAGNGKVALKELAASPPDAVVTDLEMPELDGLGLLRALREQGSPVPVIVLTAARDVPSAVLAMQAGAVDYLTKPFELEQLLIAVRRAIEHERVRSENQHLRYQLRDSKGTGLHGLVGVSEPMQTLYRLVKKVAPSNATVLITGESGTGKGEVARTLHALSSRAEGPFVSVHCAALAETVLESELFGHERGSFTGADRRRIGRFEAANGGTLFLDEIGDISPATQVKLLDVLQERELRRVGGNDPVSIDVRVIAATHRDLPKAVREGSFREDLFYRLNVVHLEVPPLRARGEDIPMLADLFLKRFSSKNGTLVEGFTDQARSMLCRHAWPGNVRELENAIERAVVMCDARHIAAQHLPDTTSRPDSRLPGLSIPGATMAEVERYAIVRTLDAVGGSTLRAAQALNISVRTIQYRLQEYGMAKKRGRPASEPPPPEEA